MMTYQEFVEFYEYMPKWLEHSEKDMAACLEQDQDVGMSWDRYVVKLDGKFTVVDVKLYTGEEEIKFTLPTDPELARRARRLITEDANFKERYPGFKE